MNREVRTSGKAVVFHGDRMLAIRLHDSDGDFYILPGGGQIAGELLPETVRREVAEETGIAVDVGDAVFVIEGSEGEPFHRVDIVFRCEYRGTAENAARQADHNQTGYDWLEIGKLNRLPLYPSKLRRPIMNLYEGKPNSVWLGNECVGDPEITD